MISLLIGASLGLLSLTAALPQGNTNTIPPSPTGLDCTLHQDHWDCTTPCSTVTSTVLAIDATVTSYAEWLQSMNSKYSTSGVAFSGTRVFVHTSVVTGNFDPFTGYGVYDSHALTQAGYKVITGYLTTTKCPPKTTASLPPSPTGSVCSPHGDHWHCDPTSTSPPGQGVCEPHGDHWHCPSGVPEPTSPPSTKATGGLPPSPTGSACAPHGDHWHCEPTSSAPTQGGGECEAHGDHWHCPDGVPEPTSPPGVVDDGGNDGAHDGGDHGGQNGDSDRGQCEAHGDHWHCPEGVAEPSTPPPPSGGPQSGQCEAHGDHWHCPEGAPEPSTPPAGASPTRSQPAVVTGGASGISLNRSSAFGMSIMAVVYSVLAY